MTQEFDKGRRKTLIGLAVLGLASAVGCIKVDGKKSLVSASLPIPPVVELKPSISINEEGMGLEIFLPEGFGRPDIGKVIYRFLPGFFDFGIGKSTSAPYNIQHFFLRLATTVYPESGKEIRCIFQAGYIDDPKPRLIYNELYPMDDASQVYHFDLSWRSDPTGENWLPTKVGWYKNDIKMQPIKPDNPFFQKASWINHQTLSSLI